MGRPARARRQRGAAIVEFALVSPILAMVVFGVLDLSRVAQLKNHLSAAAREGAAVAQFWPTDVDHLCSPSVVDAVSAADAKLAAQSGFGVTIAKRNASTGALTAYTGCGTASGSLTISPGDRLVVTVKADMTMFTPLASAFVGGSTIHVSRTFELVVQG